MREGVNISQKPFYRSFLKSLGYLQEAFESKYSLLDRQDYEFITQTGFASKYFKSVSNEYATISDIVELKFINETNQIETQRVTRINKYFDHVRRGSSYYFVKVMRQIMNFYVTDETKLIAYDAYKYFFKTILVYALDIEKVMCLACLVEFIHLQEIQRDLLDDQIVVECLESLRSAQSSTEAIQARLQSQVEALLRFGTSRNNPT